MTQTAINDDKKEKIIDNASKVFTSKGTVSKVVGAKAQIFASNVSSMVQEYLEWSDLSALGSSPDSIRQAFAKIYNKTPDGIALNNTTYFDAVQPPITKTYSHYCYKRLGNATYGTSSTDPSGQSDVIGENNVINNGDTEASMQVTVNGTWSNTATASSSITAGMKMSAGVTLEGIFEMGLEFSISSTIGQSTSQTQSRSQTTSVTVKVPPKSSVKVNMVATFKKETMDYTVPIAVSGMLGANFPDTVQGHYFWFASIGSLTNGKVSGSVTGTISGVMGSNVQTIIQPAVPIK